jgi:hypothetical protein
MANLLMPSIAIANNTVALQASRVVEKRLIITDIE